MAREQKLLNAGFYDNRVNRVARALFLIAEEEMKERERFYIKQMESIPALRDMREDKLTELYKEIVKAIPIARRGQLKKVSRWENYFYTVLRWLRTETIRPEDMRRVKETFEMWHKKRVEGYIPALQHAKLSQFNSPGDVEVFLKKHKEIDVDAAKTEVTGEKDKDGGLPRNVDKFSIPEEALAKIEKVMTSGPFVLYKFTGDDIYKKGFGEHIEKARWCIKPSWGVKYQGETYYLVTHGNDALVLMDIPSKQIKDTEDRALSPELAAAVAPLIRHVFPKPPADDVAKIRKENNVATRLEHLVDAWTPQKHLNLDVLDFVYYFTRSLEQPMRLSAYLLPPTHAKSDIMAVFPYVWPEYLKEEKSADPNEVLEELRAALKKASSGDDRSLFLLAAYYAIEYGFWANISNDAKREASKKPDLAVLYAVINQNRVSKEMERIIMQDATAATDYAIHMVKQRWPEAEEEIKKNKKQWKRYCDELGVKEDEA